MTTFGLLSTGFVPKTLTDVRADLDAAMRSKFGLSLTLGDSSLLGIIDGIMAERYAELWALAQAVYSSQDPDAATGMSLDNICKLTGTFRTGGSYSSAAEILTGTPGTFVPQHSQIGTASTNIKFQTAFAATLAAVSAWVANTGYVVGDRRTNGGNVYQCTTAGTSAASGGPSGTAASITDNAAVWTYLGSGTAAVDVTATSVDVGPVFAAARDLTNVSLTPVAGWTGAINLLDASLGVNAQTDQQLRLTREAELGGEGTSTADAIRAAILKVSGVTSCTVFMNITDVTDANGLPPHSVMTMVLGGTDAAIATVLLAEVAAGIATYGTSSASATDTQGVAHTMYFQRPTAVPIYIDITVTYDAAKYPSNGDAAIQQAIATFGAAFAVGRDVTASGVAAQAFSVAGVLDASPVKIGTAPSPTGSTTIPIDLLHLATFDTIRITVHSSAVTP